MNPEPIAHLVEDLVRKKNFAEAERLLCEAHTRAAAQDDLSRRHEVLSELIELYCVMDPPQLAKAEALSIQRESIMPTAYSRLQTAMILQCGWHDYARAVPKLEEAIAAGKAEHDDRTTYTSLSLLGQASLELGSKERARQVLDELESMVARKGKFVVGDETGFLDRLQSRGIEVERVSRLASILALVCRDATFKKRLQELGRVARR